VPRPSILFASLMNGAAWGGSEELWFRTALRASADGLDVACAMYGWPERRPRLEALRAAGARVVELPNEGRARRSLAERLRFALSTRPLRRRALAALPFERYERTVLSQGGWQDLAAAEWGAVRPRLRRYAILFHNFDAAMSIGARRWKRLAAWIDGAAANLFAAEDIRKRLEQRLGRAVPNAGPLVNPISFDPPERAVPLPPGPPWRFAVLAALDVRRKAQDALMEALAGPVWRTRPVEVSLYGAGPDRELLAARLRQLGLDARVRLEGHTGDVRGVLERAHVLLQLTRIDAMPIAVLEALALGRPAAVTRLGDMPVWVRAGENGWIAPDASPGAVAAALEEVWASRYSWSTMGERAHRIFRERCPASAERRLLDAILAW
jgi:glycosyltransferase involved in cell wall biosynthesis